LRCARTSPDHKCVGKERLEATLLVTCDDKIKIQTQQRFRIRAYRDAADKTELDAVAVEQVQEPVKKITLVRSNRF
jgi:DNA polymerase/3'-5' exonuclease PolX